jgi:subtilisin family serine protease
MQAEGGFCAPTPAAVDARIATAINAISVSAPDTPPIAILDTGVAAAVPEIGDRLVAPFDATTGGSDSSDLDGHGTEVAGLAAGGTGLIRGTSPTSPIMPVRVFNRLGASSVQWLVAGINWAAEHGAAAINISSATAAADASAAEITALTRAASDAFNRGALVVAAAGNEGTAQADLPASLPHVLAVGASDLTGARATFSNTGPWVDVVAPAASMTAPSPSAYCPSGYGVANGTSFAAPSVSGAIALLAKLRPTLSAQQRFDVLRTSARDVDPAGRDDETGFGLLNVEAAVAATAPPLGSSPEVDDDPFYVRGPFSKTHPTRLTKARKVRLTGQVSPAKDPADVYPVRLKKGERFVASAIVTGRDSLISLGLWKPAVGDFDVSNGVAKQQIVSSGGFASDPVLKLRATKAGTYFVSVEAPDALDPDDPTAVVPSSEPYRLVLSKQPPPVKKK